MLVSIVLLVLFFKVWWLKNIEMVISMGQFVGVMVVNKLFFGGFVFLEYSLGQII